MLHDRSIFRLTPTFSNRHALRGRGSRRESTISVSHTSGGIYSSFTSDNPRFLTHSSFDLPDDVFEPGEARPVRPKKKVAKPTTAAAPQKRSIDAVDVSRIEPSNFIAAKRLKRYFDNVWLWTSANSLIGHDSPRSEATSFGKRIQPCSHAGLIRLLCVISTCCNKNMER